MFVDWPRPETLPQLAGRRTRGRQWRKGKVHLRVRHARGEARFAASCLFVVETRSMRNPLLIELTRGPWSRARMRAPSRGCAPRRGFVQHRRRCGPRVPPLGDQAAASPAFVESARRSPRFGAPEIALASGSHAGAGPMSRRHAMLARAGLPVAELAAVRNEPMDAATAGNGTIGRLAQPLITTARQACGHAGHRGASRERPRATGARASVQQRVRRSLEDRRLTLGPDALASTAAPCPTGDAAGSLARASPPCHAMG